MPISYCYFKCIVGAYKSSGPPHSSRPPECGCLVAYVYLHEDTSNPLLSEI